MPKSYAISGLALQNHVGLMTIDLVTRVYNFIIIKTFAF